MIHIKLASLWANSADEILPVFFLFLCPATKKVAGYYVISSEILSVRPSVRPSVSAPTILLPATLPTVLYVGKPSSAYGWSGGFSPGFRPPSMNGRLDI